MLALEDRAAPPACTAQGRRRTSAPPRGAGPRRSGRTACRRACGRSPRSRRRCSAAANEPAPPPASVLIRRSSRGAPARAWCAEPPPACAPTITPITSASDRDRDQRGGSPAAAIDARPTATARLARARRLAGRRRALWPLSSCLDIVHDGAPPDDAALRRSGCAQTRHGRPAHYAARPMQARDLADHPDLQRGRELSTGSSAPRRPSSTARSPGEYRILIVDDNSPDGTGPIADSLASELDGRRGASPAGQERARAGLPRRLRARARGRRRARDRDGRRLLPRPALSAGAARRPPSVADLVLGSRYVAGGGVRDWGLARRLISRGGGIYARRSSASRCDDLTGGFKCIRREVLEAIDLPTRPGRGIRLPDRGHLPGAAGRLHASARSRSCSRTARRERARCRSRIALEAMWLVPTLRRGRRTTAVAAVDARVRTGQARTPFLTQSQCCPNRIRYAPGHPVIDERSRPAGRHPPKEPASSLPAPRVSTSARRRRTAVAALLALAGLLVGGLLIAVSVGQHADAAAAVDPPGAGRRSPAPSPKPASNLHAGGAIAALVLMFDLLRGRRLGSRRELSARTVLMAIAALHAVVLLAPPLVSTDIFSYQAYARMGALYGINPYLTGPHAIAPGIRCSRTSAPSGPTSRASTGRCSRPSAISLAPLSIAASVAAYKRSRPWRASGSSRSSGNAARLRGVDPARAAALVGLNPLLVLYGVGGGHNDLLMLLALAGAMYAILLSRERLGGGADRARDRDQADRRADAAVRDRGPGPGSRAHAGGAIC